MKKSNWSPLDLLDDSTYAAPNFAWQELTRTAVVTPKVVPAAKPSVQAAAAKAPAPENKVFSSSPTLRQLMQEYNRPVATRAPIKSNSGTPTASPADFNFVRVDYIRIPHIPGKILRPMSV